MLVCVTESLREPPSGPLAASALEAAGSKLLGRWENADWPAVFVEPDPAFRLTPSYSMSDSVAVGRERGGPARPDPRRRPKPDDFLFQPRRPSLLRHGGFARLFETLGGPLLILLGDELGEIVLQTAIDGFLASHPIIVVKDAAPPGFMSSAEAEAARLSALPLLSCFARLMSAAELMRDWTGAD
ncbi:hypothetical protein [Methylosinus sp. Sm6]|uniref:hypothetical protein n=1 Tax=Methylosinus sp. Sm6 TaxID=2866948 RepID=UPI001C9947E4|nr:hypothetical protein [Methylosinus sp. Sm6]MBY6242046.1 hypothetical protein [Methylosinus sp. Sm6]